MILLLDNYDSFVHNLARYLRQLGEETEVVRSDRIDVAGCRALAPAAIVLSPGPGRPEQAGCCVDVIRELSGTTPMLGVCLGHQAIGVAFGARVACCGPLHGSASVICHDGRELFAGCPNPMSVGRYHSLAITGDSLACDLQVTARTDDGTVMAVRHRSRPLFGVQFHPESVLTDEGSRLLGNFRSLARRFHETRRDREPVS